MAAVTITRTRRSDAVFSPDGTKVFTSESGGIGIVAAATGREIGHFTFGTALGAIAVSADGRYVAAVETRITGGAATLYRLDTQSGAVETFTNSLPGGIAFFDVAIDANGVLVASAGTKVYTLDPASGALATLDATFNANPRLQASADGSRILIDPDAINDVPLAIYRAGRGVIAQYHDYYDPYAGVSLDLHESYVAAISRDGSMVFQGYRLQLFDDRLKPVMSLADRYPFLAKAILGAAFSPDGDRLYLFGRDQATMWAFDTATGKVIGSYQVGVPFNAPHYPNDGADVSRYGNVFEIGADGHSLKLVGPDGVTVVDLDALTPSGGTDGADRISGESGSLFGFGGDDVISTVNGIGWGGEGDDIYEIHGPGGRAIEYAGQGTDLVRSWVSYALGDNIERLTLMGGASLGSGNALENVIIAGDGSATLQGAAGNDTLIGSAGIDTLDGGVGADAMTGGAGDDRYLVDDVRDIVTEEARGGRDTVVASIDYHLGDNVERLELVGKAIRGTGNALGNDIMGNASDNVLDGGGGVDTLIGYAGNDDYWVRDSRDFVIEAQPYEGFDTVHATVSYALAQDMWIEALVSAAPIVGGIGLNLTGNGVSQRIEGDGGDNVLSGLGGDDVLLGGGGNDVLVGGNGADMLAGGGGADRLQSGMGMDVLTGGDGADVFAYGLGELARTMEASDRITDFAQREGDRIDLRGADANTATTAVDAFRFIGANAFSGAAGELRYAWENGVTVVSADVDGDGRAEAFIRLAGQVSLTRADFLLGAAGDLAAFPPDHPRFVDLVDGSPGLLSRL